jgi:homoserine kinase type II
VAVLTSIDAQDVQSLAAAFELPGPMTAEGIAAGSVNTNYALVSPPGVSPARRVFFRLYEEQDLAGAEREAALLERLAAAGVPTPAPLPRAASHGGGRVHMLRGKPAALFPWREGGMRCQASVTPADCAAVGEALARVHEAGRDEPALPGRFGLPELLARVDRIADSAAPDLATLAPSLRVLLRRVTEARDPGLPRGLTHGDLFRDNVLWSGATDATVSALLDFESACEAPFAYDLMVTVLSWCFGDDFDPRLAFAMREGYERVRALSPAERRGMHAEAQLAALRFTVTRITDYAMRTGLSGPRVVKDWRRFMKRFEKLEALGPGGWRAMLGA